MADIFLSYARSDVAIAHELAESLVSRGWSVWWDPEIPVGMSWREVIEREISGAQCIVVLWSKQSVISRWVKEEADFAASRNALCPAMIESDVQIPLGFTSFQAAALWDWQGNPTHDGFVRLCRAIERLAPPHAIVAEPQVPAERLAELAPIDRSTEPESELSPSPPARAAQEPGYTETAVNDSASAERPLPAEPDLAASRRAPSKPDDFIDLSGMRLREYPALALFLLASLSLALSIFSRYFLSIPLYAVDDVVPPVLAFVALLGAAMSASQGMPFVSPAARFVFGARQRGSARVLTGALGAITCGYAAFSLVSLGADQYRMGALSVGIIEYPMALVSFAVAISFAAVAVASLSATIGGRQRAKR